MIRSLILILALFPLCATANEQEEAINACFQAQHKAVEFYKSHGINHEDYSYVCKYTTRTAGQWNCVNQSINNDNAPTFSYNQCFRTDPNTIHIEQGEEKNAANLCHEVVGMANHNPKNNKINDEIFCGINSMSHDTHEWTCVKNSVIADNSFEYSISRCLINTDAQRVLIE